MLAKSSEATRLLWDNLGLFSSIILTVWLPGNLLMNYLAFKVFSEEEIVGPIVVSKLKCPVDVASEMSGFMILPKVIWR